eukprot:9504064-Pyramimonas_sp.AAC.1
MAPKRPRAGQQQPAAAEPGHASQMVNLTPCSEDMALNGEYVSKFEAMMARLKTVQELENVELLGAQSVSQGGHGNELVLEDLKYAMQHDNTDQYQGAMNIFVHDVRWRPQKLPYNTKGIDDLANHSFSSPPSGTTRLQIHVYLEGPAEVETMLTTKRGTIKRVSPEEPVHAFLWGLDKFFQIPQNRRSVEEATRWVTAIRNTDFIFHTLTSESAVIKNSIILREEWSQRYAAVQRSPLSLLCMIIEQRKRLGETKSGKVTTEQLYSFYEGITWSTTSEKISKNTLENTSAISNKWALALSEAGVDCQQIVKRSEEAYGLESPFPSVLSIYLICSKAGKQGSGVAWMFEMIYDQFRAKNIVKANMSASALQGKRFSDCDVLAFKKELKDAILNDELNTLAIPQRVKTTIRNYLQSPSAYRAKEGFPDNQFARFVEPVAQTDWKQEFGRPERLFDSFASTLIYGKGYNNTILQALKLGKSPADALRYGSMGQDLQKVHSAIEEEKQAAEEKKKTAKESTKEDGEQKEDDTNKQEEENELNVKEDDDDARQRWFNHASSLVRSRVTLVAPGPNEGAVIAAIKDTAAVKKAQCTSCENVLVLYNCKEEGQNKTQPTIRMPVN